MEIRAATKEDQTELLREFNLLWPGDPRGEHEDEIAKTLSDAKAQIFVLDRGEGLGGFIVLSERSVAEGCWDGPVGYVEGWFVDEDLRGAGWGRRLMERAKAWAKEQGYACLGSDAEIENEGSIAAHKAIGFTETERLVTFTIEIP